MRMMEISIKAVEDFKLSNFLRRLGRSQGVVFKMIFILTQFTLKFGLIFIYIVQLKVTS